MQDKPRSSGREAPLISDELRTLRSERLVKETADGRTDAERDVDRILFSTAFRRLGGVTQVVLAGEDGHLFHNRLTHSIKVARLGRHISNLLLARIEEAANEPGNELLQFLELGGGLDPEVVYAACLAHDLGHPPFGHTGEQQLNASAKANGLAEGFEGNAQSFRIVTRLALLYPGTGLNLTRATLNATSKYPWLYEDLLSGRRYPQRWLGRGLMDGKKFGCYEDDRRLFAFARKKMALPRFRRTIEAQIMDWADDIAYSVHDLDDFFRTNLIPLDWLGPRCASLLALRENLDHAADWVRTRASSGDTNLTEVLREALSRWSVATEQNNPEDLGLLEVAKILEDDARKRNPDGGRDLTTDELLTMIESHKATAYEAYPEIRELIDAAIADWWVPTWGAKPTPDEFVSALTPIAMAPFVRPYCGNDQDRALLRQYTGTLTTRYVQGLEAEPGHWVDAVTITDKGLVVEGGAKREVAILKALTRIYVHKDSTLGAQQEGERCVIEHLFNSYLASIQKPGGGDIFPRRVVEDARKMANEGGPKAKMVRFVVDVIAAMTEAQAIAAYERLMGNDFGSLTEGALL